MLELLAKVENDSTLSQRELKILRSARQRHEQFARESTPVEILVAGAGVYICDQCVETCVEYIRMKRAGEID